MKTMRQTGDTRLVRGVSRTLRKAANTARKPAKIYGAPIYKRENGYGGGEEALSL